MTDRWAFRADVLGGSSATLIDYSVEALDGSIGRVTEESSGVGSSFVVVDTGFWIFGQKRLIPASAIRGADEASSILYLDMTKDEIKSAPVYVEESNVDDGSGYGDEHDIYYRPWFGVRS